MKREERECEVGECEMDEGSNDLPNSKCQYSDRNEPEDVETQSSPMS
jgi:hypothetical protein